MSAYLADQIEANGGWISFERFMEIALYAPGMGYYTGRREIFGAEGDYVTAPGIGSLFATCLAGQIAEVFEAMGTPARPADAYDILEFGAGNGAMAVALLDALAQRDALPKCYRILETSGPLQSRQEEQVASLPSELRKRVQWIHSVPEKSCGVVLANEVLDAMPVQRFRVDRTGNAVLLGVTIRDGAFAWQAAATECEIVGALGIVEQLDLPAGYESECSRLVPAWIRSVADSLSRGLMILVDYGYDRRTYYHEDRSSGTLMCHYRHHAHTDPFLWPGLQDITAHVDFTLVADAAEAAGLEVLGYSDQAGFLLQAGLPALYAERLETVGVGSKEAMALAAETRRLTMPQEMGEQFKVIALGRNVPQPSAFGERNLLTRLWS